MDCPEFLTLDEACARIGISRYYLDIYMDKLNIKKIKPDGTSKWLIDHTDCESIIEYIRKSKV